MANRKNNLARLTLLLLCLCLAWQTVFPGRAAAAGAPRDTGGYILRWTFRPDDLLACQTAAADLRQARREFGDAVLVEAVAVGVEPELMQSFLRHERLTGIAVRHMSERQYRTAFRSDPTPTVALVQGQRVVEVFAIGMPIAGRRSTAAIVPTVRGLVALAALSPRNARRP